MSSTDPFFATVSAIRKFFRKSLQAKFEVKLQVSPDNKNGDKGTEIAAGSINLHDTFFGERFNIKTVNDEIATSACIGLDIERIMLACFAQHGVEPEKWPARLAEIIFANPAYSMDKADLMEKADA